MSREIMINGAAGTGKTTLAYELAKRLDFQQIDLDNYYFRWDKKTPYSESCSPFSATKWHGKNLDRQGFKSGVFSRPLRKNTTRPLMVWIVGTDEEMP